MGCSGTTSLPELARDAALLFDPLDVSAIAQALEKLWCDASLRDELRLKGYQRASEYSWTKLAEACRSLYRAAAGESLDDADQKRLVTAGVRTPG